MMAYTSPSMTMLLLLRLLLALSPPYLRGRCEDGTTWMATAFGVVVKSTVGRRQRSRHRFETPMTRRGTTIGSFVPGRRHATASSSWTTRLVNIDVDSNTALYSLEDEWNVLRVSTDPAHSLGDALDIDLRGGGGGNGGSIKMPTTLSDPLTNCRLHALEVDPRLALSNFQRDLDALFDAADTKSAARP